MNMRPGPNNNNNNKRGRGRGRGKHHGGGGGGGGSGGGGGGGGGQRHQSSSANQDQVFNIHRTIDSNGPDVKIRGNAHHIYEKYLQLARDANSSGDRVMAENYLQHAEHYYRLIMAYQANLQAQQGGHSQPYGSSAGQQGQQAGHYGSGPYRNPQGGGQQGEPNGNTLEGNGGNGNGNGNGNGSHGEAIVTSSHGTGSSSQDDVYSEEDNGRYD
jgi:hypothetical protein